ncbi:hypothetical protein KR222_005898 [Zaprionus bogoriensis]|nr:hypothetical protein KR222_005898 [Zaprionus bogoriensis]
MFKATSTVLLLLGLAVCANSAQVRQRFVPRRGLARQEQAAPPSPAPTGYPEAGVTPEVPFELPSSTAQPEVNYLPPDNTYGPPDSVYGPPDSVYGPPTSVDDVEDVQISEAEPEPEQQPESAIETDDIPAPVEDEVAIDAKIEPADEELLVEVAEDGTVIAVSTTLDQPEESIKSARFYQRFPQGRRRQQPVPQRLVLRRSW